MPNYKEICLPAGAKLYSHSTPSEKKNNQRNNKSQTQNYHNGNNNSRNTLKHKTSPNVNTSGTYDNSRSYCQNPLQTRSTPPVVIFQNKSIVLQNYPFEVNANAGIYEEIKGFRWPNLVKADLSSSEANGISSDDVEKVVLTNGVSASIKKEVNGAAKSIDCDKFRLQDEESAHKILNLVTENTKNGGVTNSDTLEPHESTHNGLPQFISETKTAAKPKMNLKERMYARIKQQAQNKEKHNDYLENKGEQCSCGNCDDFVNCPTWCHKCLSFNESIGPERRTPFLKKSIFENQRVIIKKIETNLMVHGSLILKPISTIEETFIDENIQSYLKSLRDFSVKDIQRYVWPAVQRGLNVFMVSSPKSGKTFAYLPAICSFCNEKNDRYFELAKYKGPLVVILCSTDDACTELAKITRELVSHGSEEVTVEVLVEGSKVQNNCDILITTPSILEGCVKSGTVTLKRLCHLVIENAHVVLRTHHKSIRNLLQLVNTIQTNRPYNKNIQIIVTSEKWSMDMDTLLKKLYTTPIVCFGDFLEAAVYSKIQFKKTKLKTALKLYYLSDKLKQQSMTHKTVVFCNEDLPKIRDHLEVSGVECIALPNKLSEEEIFENTDMWKSLRCGHYKVLLCSDSTFAKTENVLNADWIFHYSPPSDYTKFQKRFKCLSRNLCSPLDPEEDNSDHLPQEHSFIVIDEGSINQFIFDLFENLIQNSAKYLQL